MTRVLLATFALLLALAGCTGAPAPAPTPTAPPTPAAVPAAGLDVVDIPAIRARSTLVPLGLTNLGTLATPPVETPEQASVYDLGPRPGEVGPAVVLGHVSGGGRPGVFSRLANVEVGDQVLVTRPDGDATSFRVTDRRTVPKDQFPTSAVYSDTPGPELRLITCGGAFDGESYSDNVIVFARE